jgi:expansin (peptidoglycan-binding protein)
MRYRTCLLLLAVLLAPAALLRGALAAEGYKTFIPIARSAPAAPAASPPTLPFDPAATHTGDGTYYDATGDGNCMFGPSPGDLMVAAMNQTDYYDSLLCGAYIEATGPKGSVTVRIVDRCPECQPGDVDFSPQAFAKIADLPQGRVRIAWRLLSPPLAGPIAYRFKEGSSQWWTAVQIRNHRNPVYSVEYLSGGRWVPMERQQYNYFVAASGTGPGPLTLRVTDIYGNQLSDSGIPIAPGVVRNGSGQFPPAP